MQLSGNRQAAKRTIYTELNDKEMLAEILRELTKCDENMTILSEHVLTWAKRIEAQRTQIAVISSLHEIKKTFHTIMHNDGKKRKRPTTNVTASTRRCKYCGQADSIVT